MHLLRVHLLRVRLLRVHVLRVHLLLRVPRVVVVLALPRLVSQMLEVFSRGRRTTIVRMPRVVMVRLVLGHGRLYPMVVLWQVDVSWRVMIALSGLDVHPAVA